MGCFMERLHCGGRAGQRKGVWKSDARAESIPDVVGCLSVLGTVGLAVLVLPSIS